MANTAIFGVKGQCWYMDEYSSFQESLGDAWASVEVGWSMWGICGQVWDCILGVVG